MSLVHVYACEGRSVEQKRQLVKGMTDVVCSAFEVKPQTVQIHIFDQPPAEAAQAGVVAVDEAKS